VIFEFIKASPAKNTTVIITSECPKSYYPVLAKKAMSYDYLHSEQVGFIVPPSKKGSVIGLEMAGGEFCGNATLAAAAYAVYKGLTNKEIFNIDTSGTDESIRCRVAKVSDFCYSTSCTMPSAKGIDEAKIKLLKKTVEGYIVEFDGISHFVLEAEDDIEEYLELARALKEIVDAGAIGIIPYKKVQDGRYKIKPFVHVRAINSNVFERGCGSGSLALGACLKKVYGISKDIDVIQPGGVIKVGMGDESYISTDVIITCEGKILI